MPNATFAPADSYRSAPRTQAPRAAGVGANLPAAAPPTARRIAQSYAVALGLTTVSVGSAVAAAALLPPLGLMAGLAAVVASRLPVPADAHRATLSSTSLLIRSALSSACVGIAMAAWTAATPVALVVCGAVAVGALVGCVALSWCFSPETLRQALRDPMGSVLFASAASVLASFVIPAGPALYAAGTGLFAMVLLLDAMRLNAELRLAAREVGFDTVKQGNALAALAQLMTCSAAALSRFTPEAMRTAQAWVPRGLA